MGYGLWRCFGYAIEIASATPLIVAAATQPVPKAGTASQPAILNPELQVDASAPKIPSRLDSIPSEDTDESTEVNSMDAFLTSMLVRSDLE